MKFFTTREVAEILRVTEYTICEWLKAGKLKGIKLEGKSWRVTESDLREFIDSQEASA